MKAWEKNVRTVVPYVPGEQPNQIGMIKLNTNENPYPPAPAVEAALHDLSVDSLRLYPDPVVSKLNTAIADFYGVKPEQVFSGVGSDDVLAMCFLTFFNSKKPIFFPDVTYGFYPVWSELFQIPYEKKPLNDRFELVIDGPLYPQGAQPIKNQQGVSLRQHRKHAPEPLPHPLPHPAAVQRAVQALAQIRRPVEDSGRLI